MANGESGWSKHAGWAITAIAAFGGYLLFERGRDMEIYHLQEQISVVQEEIATLQSKAQSQNEHDKQVDEIARQVLVDTGTMKQELHDWIEQRKQRRD